MIFSCLSIMAEYVLKMFQFSNNASFVSTLGILRRQLQVMTGVLEIYNEIGTTADIQSISHQSSRDTVAEKKNKTDVPILVQYTVGDIHLIKLKYKYTVVCTEYTVCTI
jgi:hypothetical protein